MLSAGPTPEQRDVPLYVIKLGQAGLGDTGEIVLNLQIAPTILTLIDVTIPETMKQSPIS